jgi:RHS repeat-associated protein
MVFVFNPRRRARTRTRVRPKASSYGWLGTKKRSADSLGGLTLMGVRLYNPATGRFLSTDPVYGGNANPYVYPSDPVNASDTSGESKSGDHVIEYYPSVRPKGRIPRSSPGMWCNW